MLEAEVTVTSNKWQKHPIVTDMETWCILGMDYIRRGYFRDPKGYQWAFGVAAVDTESIKQLSSLPIQSLSESVCCRVAACQRAAAVGGGLAASGGQPTTAPLRRALSFL